MIKKRKILIAVSLALTAILAAVYFFVIEPMQTDIPTDASGRELIFEQVARERMLKLKVTNQHGEYTLRRSGEGTMYIEEHPKVILDSEKLSYLVVYAGTTYTDLRVNENAESELWKYGLDEESQPCSIELTTTGGSHYKLLIGNLAPNRTGYYVTLEGSGVVHIYNKAYADVLLAPVENLVSGLLTFPGDMNYYYLASNFMLFEDDELKICTTYLNQADRSELEAATVHKLLAPVQMGASSEYDGVLQTFVEFMADEVVEVGLTEELLVEYGFDSPKYLISYIGGYVVDGEVKQQENMISISEKTEDGYYYVASPMFDIIGKVKEGTLAFLEWELINWVNPQIFAVAISNVASVEFFGGADSEIFTLKKAGKDIAVLGSKGDKIDTDSFKQLYLGMLNLNIEGYTALDAEQIESIIASPDSLITSIKVTSNSGGTLEYGFYRYSDVRALVTVKQNSQSSTHGEFFVPVTSVKKLVSDVTRLKNGEAVSSVDKY